MLLAGHDNEAKQVVQSLALDLGFGECLDLGGADQVILLEAFAKVWINLAIMKGQGRNIAWQLLRR
jgi:predicted dinucleotide-binding enzyme